MAPKPPILGYTPAGLPIWDVSGAGAAAGYPVFQYEPAVMLSQMQGMTPSNGLAPRAGANGASAVCDPPLEATQNTINSWRAGGVFFLSYRCGNRVKIGACTSRGWKSWYPYRPVVLGKNPTSRQVRRVTGKLKGWLKTYRSVAGLLGFGKTNAASKAARRR